MPIFINQARVESFNFPGGECHIKLPCLNFNGNAHILACLNGSDDILSLLLTVDAIRRVQPDIKLTLTIPYFPYGRQDRVCNPGEALSVMVMADLINSLHCHQVIVLDPHSDVTPALLKNCKTIPLVQLVVGSMLVSKIQQEHWALVAPDAGAKRKSEKWLSSSPRNSMRLSCTVPVRSGIR